MSSTLVNMSEEIKYQIDDLPMFIRYLATLDPAPDSEKGGNDCIFIGSGDSFAAAKASEYLSGFRARALDPYDLALNPEAAEGKHVFAVSVSGRMRTNIEAAKAARRAATRVTAITSDPRSILAENCDDLIKLNFRRTGGPTPGTVSFTTTLLACFSRVKEVDALPDLGKEFDRCVGWSDSTDLLAGETIFIVGTGLGYCMAIYGSAKIYEVLGRKSQYQATEQFSHMELFSLSSDDSVILLPGSKQDRKISQLENLLATGGWNVAKIGVSEDNEVAQSIRTAMCLQVFAWRSALKLGLEEFSFKKREKHLRVSNMMIY